jgi:hypothetical protein
MKKLSNKTYMYIIDLFLCLAFLNVAMITAEINNSTNSSNNNLTNEFSKLINPSNFTNPMNIKLFSTPEPINPSNFNELSDIFDNINNGTYTDRVVINLQPDVVYTYTKTLNILSNVNVTINGNGATLNGANNHQILHK